MSLRHLMICRNLSTSRVLARPSLSSEYKSNQLWEARFNCPMLNDSARIKVINSKILMGNTLDNLELDIFINIAASRSEDVAHLQEAVRLLKTFRRGLEAHTMLPSTHHATCRLFLESNRLSSLMTLLERRVDHGIFPDAFALNLIFDEALKQNKLPLASRAAALVMIQEEFGMNKICDRFAMYSIASYIESKTDFNDWIELNMERDVVFNENTKMESGQEDKPEEKSETAQQDVDEEEEEEDDEDAEYHRVPFLRNPYFDDHFDLTNPRVICGKTLSMLGMHEETPDLASRCQILGSILQGRWSEALAHMEKSVQSKVMFDASLKDLAQHYVNQLHGVEAPGDQTKSCLLSSLEKLNLSSESKLSVRAEEEFANISDLEQIDINWMKRITGEWSSLRIATMNAMQQIEAQKKLIDEIRAKKEELKKKEEFLYFYDKLKKRTLTRIDYN